MERPEGHRSRTAITALANAAQAGDRTAQDKLFKVVYHTLHEVAHRQRLRWRGNETLNTTALVHEAYFKLFGRSRTQVENRSHFFRIAAKAMRQVLINYAEKSRTQKAGGDLKAVSLSDYNPVAPEKAEELIALNESLTRLAGINARANQVVELRFFSGLTVQQTATSLGVSTATVKRDWTFAQAWLQRDMGLPQ